ncbi:Abi-alpha family protein [Sphingomonas zeae]
MTIDVTKMIEPVQAALAPAGGTLSEAWAAVIGDRIAAWRLKNAAALQVEVNRQCADLGLKLDRAKIPERYAVAWFDEATKQDEPEIQTLFARLLARAANGDPNASDRRLIELVGRLTPLDAQVLAWLFHRAGLPPRHPQCDESAAWGDAQNEFGRGAAISMNHFVVLGIFERQFTIRQEASFASYASVDGYPLGQLADALTGDLSLISSLVATSLGLALYHACIEGSPSPAG